MFFWIHITVLKTNILSLPVVSESGGLEVRGWSFSVEFRACIQSVKCNELVLCKLRVKGRRLLLPYK
jgi:hypothetical protein